MKMQIKVSLRWDKTKEMDENCRISLCGTLNSIFPAIYDSTNEKVEWGCSEDPNSIECVLSVDNGIQASDVIHPDLADYCVAFKDEKIATNKCYQLKDGYKTFLALSELESNVQQGKADRPRGIVFPKVRLK